MLIPLLLADSDIELEFLVQVFYEGVAGIDDGVAGVACELACFGQEGGGFGCDD